MKNLILIRHAKAEPCSPSGRDIDRAISDSGAAAAEAVSSKAASFMTKPYMLWSSNAKRTSQTARIFCKNLGASLSEVVFKDELYTFNLRELEQIIRSCETPDDCLVIFGHNEAITDFVNNFGDIYIDNVPTSGFVAITFDTDRWSDIKNGKTIKTIFPRDL